METRLETRFDRSIRIEEGGQIRFNSGKLKFSLCHRKIENWRERLLASSFKFSKESEIVTFHRFSIGEAITQKGFDIFRRKNCFGIWNEEEREREMAGRDGWLNVRQTDRHVGGTDRFVVSDTVAARNAC